MAPTHYTSFFWSNQILISPIRILRSSELIAVKKCFSHNLSIFLIYLINNINKYNKLSLLNTRIETQLVLKYLLKLWKWLKHSVIKFKKEACKFSFMQYLRKFGILRHCSIFYNFRVLKFFSNLHPWDLIYIIIVQYNHYQLEL